jgi:hypothetical protein
MGIRGNTRRIAARACAGALVVVPLVGAPASALVNENDPAITSAPGPEREGQKLTAYDGTWNYELGESGPITTTRQWLRCDPSVANCNIVGTDTEYILVAADVGKRMVLRVVADCTVLCTPATEDSAPTGVVLTDPSNEVPPSIVGTLRDGETLSIGGNQWSGSGQPVLAYQWLRCDASGASCAAIDGATGATYTLQGADVNGTIRVRVTGSGGASAPVQVTSLATDLVAAAPPKNSTPPVVGGTFREGETVGSFVGIWTGTAPLSYSVQWQRCSTPDPATCRDIEGATDIAYRIGSPDVNQRLRLVVIVDNPAPGTSEPLASEMSTAVVALRRPAKPRPLRRLAPFPKVAIGGTARPGGAQISLLRVRGPRGATVTVSCRGRSCPVRSLRRRIRKGRVRIRKLERRLPAGTEIELRVTKPGRIGKYTRFRIRSSKGPARVDKCLLPGAEKPTSCPGK